MTDTRLRRTALACLLLLVAGCAPPDRPRTVAAARVPTPRTSASPTPDPATVGANELGDVPVLMYHRIVARPKSVYDRTPVDFRAELERLAKEHYVPVTASDYTAGRIDIPAGTHPVVLTFDDGDPSQFTLTAAGVPASDTAVAILQDVAHA
ncbi:xylanase, partial [Kibdelosporangium lantanae]